MLMRLAKCRQRVQFRPETVPGDVFAALGWDFLADAKTVPGGVVGVVAGLLSEKCSIGIGWVLPLLGRHVRSRPCRCIVPAVA